jgi:hypothetical protein
VIDPRTTTEGEAMLDPTAPAPGAMPQTTIPPAAPAAIPTIETLDLDEYVRMVGEASEIQLSEGIRDNRDAILDLIFAGMERHYRGGVELSAVVHWEILDRADGGRDVFETVLAGGRAQSSRTPQHAAQVELRVGAVDFVRLVTGHVTGTKLYARRRLRAKGNLKLAARIPSMFAIPGAGS